LLSYDVIGLGKEAGGKEYNVGVIPDKTLKGGRAPAGGILGSHGFTCEVWDVSIPEG